MTQNGNTDLGIWATIAPVMLCAFLFIMGGFALLMSTSGIGTYGLAAGGIVFWGMGIFFSLIFFRALCARTSES